MGLKEKIPPMTKEEFEKHTECVNRKMTMLAELIEFNSKCDDDGNILGIGEWVMALSNTATYLIDDVARSTDDFEELFYSNLILMKRLGKSIIKDRKICNPVLKKSS